MKKAVYAFGEVLKPKTNPGANREKGTPPVKQKARGQATDPNPDTDPNTGAALRSIRNTSDAVTDPGPTLQVAFLKAVIRG